MPNYTTNLNLLKKDPATEGNDYFNIETMLNENWDKIDAGVTALNDTVTSHEADNTAHDAVSTATANKIIVRDANGRAKVAAPSASDDIARKDTVDVVQANLTTHVAVTASTSAKGHVQLGTTAGTAAEGNHGHAFSSITGTVPVAQGGTGQTTLAAARNAMGLGNTTGALPIANGGTGSTTAAAALTALGLTATAAELNYTDGVTSNIQTQLNAKLGLAGGTINGNVIANIGTDYNTKRVRNNVFKTGSDFTTSELANGDIGFIY